MRPRIVPVLVGGPCDGQRVSESFFDGRGFIYATPNREATYLKQSEDTPVNEHVCLYVLREGRYPLGDGFVVFAHPDMPDAELFAAAERVQQLPSPFD